MLDFLRGDGDKISSMRLYSFIIIVSVMSVFVAHNVVAMVNGSGFVSMGMTETGLIITAVLGKTVQYFGEVRAKNTEEPLTTDAVPTDKKE